MVRDKYENLHSIKRLCSQNQQHIFQYEGYDTFQFD